MQAFFRRLVNALAHPSKKVLFRIWYIFDGFFLILPLMTLLASFAHVLKLPAILQNVFAVILLIPMFAGILLRCFYLPYIIAAVLLALSIRALVQDARKRQLQRKDLLVLLICIVICVLNLIALENVFWNAMSV